MEIGPGHLDNWGSPLRSFSRMPRRTLPTAVLFLVCGSACSKPDAADETSADASSSSTSEATSSETGCIGAEDCACTPGGGCDPGLACEQDVCVPACQVGDLGCACSEGGACLGDWVCMDGLCVEGVSATCGDGVVDKFEACDDGEDNADAGLATCTASCKTPTCGDGLVHAGEACDGGEGCAADCTLSTCGNGQLDPGEECEPAGEEDPECLATCLDGRKLIFVTSQHYKGGEIGGVAGADEKCQALAKAAGRPGIFRAWLASSPEDAPAVRFTWADVPYVDAAGVVLAEGWEEIGAAPVLDERGEMVTESEIDCAGTNYVAWSSDRNRPTSVNGMEFDCDDWRSTAAIGAAARIIADQDIGINGWCGNADCSMTAPLFCVEQ